MKYNFKIKNCENVGLGVGFGKCFVATGILVIKLGQIICFEIKYWKYFTFV